MGCLPPAGATGTPSAGATGNCAVGTEAVLAAVRDLEALLHQELRIVHERCALLQDVVDDRAFVPLRRVEQRLADHDLKAELGKRWGAELRDATPVLARAIRLSTALSPEQLVFGRGTKFI